MWPWLRNEHFKKSFSLTQRQQFLGQLCLFTLCGHIIVLAVFTLSYRGYHEQERFVISSKNYNTVYVLSPLRKKIKSSGSSLKQKKSVKAAKVIDYKTYEKLKKKQKGAKKSKAAVSVAKTVHKKSSPKTLGSKHKKAQEKSGPKEHPKAQVMVKEVVAKQVDKKQSDKKQANKKQEVVPVAKVQKLPAPEIEQKDIDETMVKNNDEKLEAVADLVQEQSIEEQQNIEDDIDIDDVTFIGYEQFDSLAVQNKIQQVVQQNFKSPIGIKKDVSCELTVLVSESGKSKTVTMVRSSGILIYDSSARAMLRAIEFPKEVWNKTITIVLGQ